MGTFCRLEKIADNNFSEVLIHYFEGVFTVGYVDLIYIE